MSTLRERMLEDMQLRHYSPHTIDAYLRNITQFAQHFGTSPARLGPEHIRTYQLWLLQQQVARSTFIQAVSALRFCYETTLGRPWRYGANGPRAFDCSGMVIYAFKRAGDGRAVANGHLRSARALYHWYKSRGLASRSNPKIGDLVIWGRGTHVGIYVGHGKAISTLTRGVKIHRVRAVTASFTAYLHTGMWKKPVR